MAVEDYTNPADNLEEVDYDVRLPNNRDDQKKVLQSMRDLQRRARSYGRVVEVNSTVNGEVYLDAVKVDLWMLGSWSDASDATAVSNNFTSNIGETERSVLAYITDSVMSVEINDWVILEQNADGTYYITWNKRPPLMIKIVARAFTDEEVSNNADLGNYYQAEEYEFHHTREDDDDPNANDAWRKRKTGVAFDRDFRTYVPEEGHLPYIREVNGRRVRPGTILPLRFAEDKGGRHYWFINPYADSFWGRIVSSLVQDFNGVKKYQIKPELSDADGRLYDEPGSDIIFAAEVQGVLDIGENSRVRVFAEPDSAAADESQEDSLYHFEYQPLDGFWAEVLSKAEKKGEYNFEERVTNCENNNLEKPEGFTQTGIAKEVNDNDKIKVGTFIWIQVEKHANCGDETVENKYHFAYEGGGESQMVEITKTDFPGTKAKYEWKGKKFNKDTGVLEDDGKSGKIANESNGQRLISSGTIVLATGQDFDDPASPIYFEYKPDPFLIKLTAEGGQWNNNAANTGQYKWAFDTKTEQFTSGDAFTAVEKNGQEAIGTIEVLAIYAGTDTGGVPNLEFEYSLPAFTIELDRYEEGEEDGEYGFQTSGLTGALNLNGQFKDQKVFAKNLTLFPYLISGTEYLAEFQGFENDKPKIVFSASYIPIEMELVENNGGGNYNGEVATAQLPNNADPSAIRYLVTASELNQRDTLTVQGGSTGPCNCPTTVLGTLHELATGTNQINFESTADAPVIVQVAEGTAPGFYDISDLCGEELASDVESPLFNPCDAIGGDLAIPESLTFGTAFKGCDGAWVLITVTGELCCCGSSSGGF